MDMANDSWRQWGPDIDVQVLAGLRAEDVAHTLLDVREPNETAICAVDGSQFIPMQQIPQRAAELPRDHPLVILCHQGTRSAMVANFLRQNGFDNVFNLTGGINAWAQVIDTEMARY